MRVGLTFDLREAYLAEGYGLEETAEFDKEETVAALEGCLRSLGYETDRIGHIRELVRRLSGGDRWDFVFNIAEGLHGPAREAQIPALLDAYQIPYTFSDPLVLSLTLHKGLTKHVLRDRGIPTADFQVVESTADLAEVSLPFPLFIKPVGEGTGKGISAASRVTSRDGLIRLGNMLIEKFRQPVLIERFLPGREFTVGVVGTGSLAESIGVMEVVLLETAEPFAYSFNNKEDWKGRIDYRIVHDEESREAERVALAAWRVLGCRDGGRLDLRSDEMGRPQFIEVNPLAGLNPDHSDLPILGRLVGVSYEQLVGRIVGSTLLRMNGGPVMGPLQGA